LDTLTKRQVRPHLAAAGVARAGRTLQAKALPQQALRKQTSSHHLRMFARGGLYSRTVWFGGRRFLAIHKFQCHGNRIIFA
jgi:hypothetical protein